MCSMKFYFEGIVPDMDTAPGLAPPVPPARGLDLEYETEGMSFLFFVCFYFHSSL